MSTTDDLACMASWIKWGISRGFLRPTEVHGFADGPRPSKKSLTMSPPLIDALSTVRVHGRVIDGQPVITTVRRSAPPPPTEGRDT